jgi:ribosomal protein S18 acetylase RimI-like enzyme
VRIAHADAWEELGRSCARAGGGHTRLPGIRLMASGLQHPQWNNGDVLDAAAVDIAAVGSWFDERGVPWGVRVPRGMVWGHGRRLFDKRLMGLTARQHRRPPAVDGLVVRRATPDDLDAVLSVDAEAFEENPAVERPWLEIQLGARSTTVVALGELAGEPVATGYAVSTNGDAGRCLYVAGIAVRAAARRRGVGAALSSWLLSNASDPAWDLAHLHPDDDGAARLYARLGFIEVPGFVVYVDNRG